MFKSSVASRLEASPSRGSKAAALFWGVVLTLVMLLVMNILIHIFITLVLLHTRGGEKVLQFGMLFSSPTRVLLCLVRTGSDKFTNRAAPLLCSLLSLKGVTSGCRWQ